MEYVLDSKKNM